MSKVACHVCHAWMPKEYNGWRYTDEYAACRYQGNTHREHTCDKASILDPLRFAAKVTRNARPVEEEVTGGGSEADLEDWYTEHEAEYAILDAVATDDKPALAHQDEAINRYSSSPEIALFWSMGVGKTLAALRIAGEKYLRGEIDALLIIAPNGVHRQWALEQIPLWLQKAVPRQVQLFGGRGGSKTARPFYNEPSLQIICTNVDTFSTPRKWMDIVEWANAHKTMIILDEATCAKNIKSKRTQRLLYEFNDVTRRGKQILSSKVKTVARAILTGTPVTNGPLDLWAVMEFIRPNFFKRNWYSFQNYYAMHTVMTVVTVDDKGVEHANNINILLDSEHWQKVKDITEFGIANSVFGVSLDTFNTIHSQDHYQGPYKHAEELRERLNEVASFKLLEDCTDMPPKSHNKKLLMMNDEIAACYKEMEEELLTLYDGKLATAKSKITAIIRLQQICSGFLSTVSTELDDDGDVMPNEITWIGKSNPKLDMLYNDVAEAAKPLIIITRFTAEAARIYNDLNEEYRCCLMTGWKRVGTIEEFKEGKYDIMIANVRVIGRGFNLQNCTNMIFYSNTFSLEDRMQVEDRIWRLGQAKPCMYTDYIYEDSVDVKIVSALKQKRSLLDYIRGVSTRSFITEADEVTTLEQLSYRD